MKMVAFENYAPGKEIHSFTRLNPLLPVDDGDKPDLRTAEEFAVDIVKSGHAQIAFVCEVTMRTVTINGEVYLTVDL